MQSYCQTDDSRQATVFFLVASVNLFDCWQYFGKTVLFIVMKLSFRIIFSGFRIMSIYSATKWSKVYMVGRSLLCQLALHFYTARKTCHYYCYYQYRSRTRGTQKERQMLTDFQNYFTVGLSNKFVVARPLLYCPLQLKRVWLHYLVKYKR